MAAYRLWERQRLSNERDRHGWEVAIAQTFQKYGYSRDYSYRLARAHFEGKMTDRPGNNGGPPLGDWP